MPRSPKDNLEIRAARRDEILEAATRVFAARGFAGTKVADIATAARLSHGLVYHYFASKEAILQAIAEEMMERVESELSAPAPRAVDRIAAAIRARRASLDAPIDPSRLVMQAMLEGSLSDDLRTKLLDHFQRIFGRLERWVEEAQREGDVDTSISASELTKVIVFVFRGMSIRLRSMPELPIGLPDADSIIQLLVRPCHHGAATPETEAAGRRQRRPSKKGPRLDS